MASIRPGFTSLTTGARPIATKPSALRRLRDRSTTFWIQVFVIFQICCQLALLSSSFGSFRLILRIASFGLSIAFLFALRGRGERHPASIAAKWILGIVFLSLFHPSTNLAAGAAQAVMYLAILAPLFWVPRLRVDVNGLRRVILILWVFYTLSAAVGVLQVYAPGRFQPNLSAVYAAMDEGFIADLSITTASGQRVLRPMGLTDIPGGAATGGFYAVLFGLGFFLIERKAWVKIACIVSIIIGLGSIYLSQLRSVLIMAAICIVTLTAILIWKRNVAKFSMLLMILVITVLGSFYLAVSLAGTSVTTRLSSLVDARPTEVYYRSRGIFLEYTLKELLPVYPLGAGLGRWGMMSSYFGQKGDPNQKALYAEIQWTGWLLDGGLPLMIAYMIALLMALYAAWKVVQKPPHLFGDLYLWGALLLAYNVSAIALTFSYPLFIGQAGLEFWLLNATILTAARNSRRSNR